MFIVDVFLYDCLLHGGQWRVAMGGCERSWQMPGPRYSWTSLPPWRRPSYTSSHVELGLRVKAFLCGLATLATLALFPS